MPALLFGSISTVVDTSELQRRAFNQAFQMHDLDWEWERDDYRGMLAASGGHNRIAAYAQSLGQQVDARAICLTKSQVFRANLGKSSPPPRPGVSATIREAKASGFKVGFVTTTSPENVSTVLAALGPRTKMSDFDVVVDASTVDHPKPDAAAYTFALAALHEQPAECVAIEDNVEGVQAAAAAGVRCVALPNENTAGHDFGAARLVVDRLDFEELRALIPAQ